MKTKQEILAPAGAEEQLIAAVRSGADAVYLGAGGFNARRNAKNFQLQELPRIVGYCHARGVAVHVTVNTLIFDDELGALEREIDAIAEAGVDAVIIQDLAVARLFQTRYPSIRRHASTQMAIHNIDGARMAQALGFDRVVLARELTLAEIRKISESVEIETEMFVHGAHCMCLSGACYLSSLIGGRSGNRGLCAQPCRTDFRVNGKHYALSLKDLSLVSRIGELSDCGVVSLKIEGRMKRPEYVAAAVTACRKSRDGEAYDLEVLEKVFSRSGFTQGFLDGKRGPRMFGVRTRADADATAHVLGSLAALYRTEYPGVAVDMALTVGTDAVSLQVCDANRTVCIEGAAPQPAQTRPLDAESARKSLSKTGGTPFFLQNLQFSCKDGVFVPASQLNALRAQALENLLIERMQITPHSRHSSPDWELAPHLACQPEFWIQCQTFAQATAVGGCDKLILPAQEILAHPDAVTQFGDKLVCAFEPVLFVQDEPAFNAAAQKIRALGINTCWTENLYGLFLAKRLGMQVYGGAALNITNSRALEVYRVLGLRAATVSFELSAKRICALDGTIPRGALVYGYLPAMQVRACPVQPEKGCKGCKGHAILTDRMDARFPYVCHGRRYGTLYNSVPLYAADRAIEGVDFRLAAFTVETPQEAARIAARIRENAPFDKPATRGLYFREVL